jgi:signal peptidase I
LRDFGPLCIPPDAYFVMGDNRDNSQDSRYFGCIARAQIVGEAKAVVVSGDLKHWLRPRFSRFCTKLE